MVILVLHAVGRLADRLTQLAHPHHPSTFPGSTHEKVEQVERGLRQLVKKHFNNSNRKAFFIAVMRV